MSDPFESDLSHLAPDIDLDRAHQTFESTRRRRRNRRRMGGGLGGAAVAAALIASVIAAGGDGTESVTADGPIGFGPSLTGTVGDLGDELPCDQRIAQFNPTCSRPTDIQPAIGGVLDVFMTGVADEFGYVIEFHPDAPWSWRDRSGRLQSNANLIATPRPVSIEAVAGVDLHQSCAAGVPEIGARVEAVPIGPLEEVAGGGLRGLAWLTLSCVDVDIARELWAEASVTLYTQRFEDREAGRGIGPWVEVSGGRVATGVGFDTESLFDRIAVALDGGLDVRAEFNPDLGYVERLVIVEEGETLIDITSRDFDSAERIEPCESTPGGPLDLSAEPAQWAISGDFTRWFDADGCPFRLDVVEHAWGPEHCGWERAQFLFVPGGDDTRLGFVFDPDGSLAAVSPEEWGYRADPADRPSTLVDTGWRSEDGFEMWTDSADPERLWLIQEEELRVWRQDTELLFGCA